MNSLLLAFITFLGYLIAYHTYGKFLSKKIFRIDPKALCPSQEMRDNLDYIPTKKEVLFGHHFASIAGLGPIVGPAIGVIWGWVPAILWIFVGSVFMGAVHDFGALVISLRGQGRSIGDLASEIINTRVRTLFLLIIFFELWIVIAIFSLIIAILFGLYPESLLPIWLQIPIAVYLGYLVYRKGANHRKVGILAVIVMYMTILLGAAFPVVLPGFWGLTSLQIWIGILLVYAFVASTLPVHVLLQPRDFINSYQLIVTMLLLSVGVVVSRPPLVAPAVAWHPVGAPPIWPFLFIIIACGAISGFHCLVSSGTSSKQCDNERSARFIGFGGMLMEGALSTLVIVAVAAGIGLGLTTKDGVTLTGAQAFTHHYSSWAAASGLSAKLDSFVTGSANMLQTIGIPAKITIAIVGVFLVSFAVTTLDSATRIQRYVVTELALSWRLKPLRGKYSATLVAVLTAFILAFSNGSGKGALALWPLFGTVNQLLAGLALLVITIYLARQKIKASVTMVPMVFMIAMTGWAMMINLKNFYAQSNWLLVSIGLIVFILEIWMVVEGILVMKKVYRSSA